MVVDVLLTRIRCDRTERDDGPQRAADAMMLGSRVLVTMEFHVLGPLEILVDGQSVDVGGPQQRAIAATLIAEVGHRVSIDALLHVLYGDDQPARGRRTVQTYVSKLRRVLGEAIVHVTGGYVLDAPAGSVDANRFETGLQHCLDRLEREPAAVASGLRTLLAMWRGHPYADVPPEGVVGTEVVRLRELRLAATEARVQADLALGRHAEVLAELDALTTAHPAREHLHAQRALALYRSGRQADALHAIASVRSMLVDELGIDPSPEVQELERRILTQDPSLQPPDRRVVRAAVVVCDLDPDLWDGERTEALVARRDQVLAVHADRLGIGIEVHGTAVVAAVDDVHDALDIAGEVARGRTGMRVVVDHGELERDRDGAVSGPPVTRATRVVTLAHPDQVLLTAAAHDALSSSPRAGRTVTSLGSHDVAGLDEPTPLYELRGDGMPGPFPPLRDDHLPPPIPAPGMRSLPGHELREQLGASELGTVHRAYQPAVGREVVVRVLPPALVADPAFVRTFEVEAQRLARLTHPAVVGLLDYWRDSDHAALVHRLIDGRPLPAVVEDEPMQSDAAVALVGRVASALEHAHARGVVHGRLRPDDVLVDEGGDPWLRDLGLGQLCRSLPGAWLHDLAAPEVLVGERPTVRTDVHGLGLVVHHVLSGGPAPVDAPLPRIGGDVDDVIERATAADPDDRHATPAALVAALARALGTTPPAIAGPTTRNPYRGLEMFTELDAADFHGRDGLVRELADALDEHGLVTAVGPSGIGKSSVVRAGLVPERRQRAREHGEHLVVVVCTPGDRPVERLAAALRGVLARPVDGVEELLGHEDGLAAVVAAGLPDDATLLLVVDQFEELFTVTSDEAERRRFLDLLAHVPRGPAESVLTLRADVLDRPLEYPGFADVMRRGLVAVGAPTTAELASIIARPARAVGVTVDEDLVAAIVAEADGHLGALPLVGHLLHELFEQRDGARIGTEDLGDAGLRGAIGRRAEQVHTGLDDEVRDLVRPLMLRLVQVDDDGAVARRRVALPDLAPDEGTAAVVERFVDARLLTIDRDPTTRTPTVEVAHEALFREWPRLSAWVEEARDALVRRQRLEAAAEQWAAADRDDAGLLRGGRLELAEALVDETPAGLGESAHEYVRASRAAAEARDAATRRRRRRTTTTLVALLVVALGLAGLAGVQSRNARIGELAAEAERAAAVRAAAAERVTALTSQADVVVERDPELALLLALEAMRIAREGAPGGLPAARSSLQTATQRNPVLWRRTDAATAVGLSPDGRLLATVRAGERTVEIRSADDGAVVRELDANRAVVDVGWYDDATLLLAFAVDDTDDPGTQVALVDADSGTWLRPLEPAGSGEAGRLLSDPSTGLVAAEVADGARTAGAVWDAATGELVARPALVAALLPGERRIVELGAEQVSITDLATGRTEPVTSSAGVVAAAAGHGLLALVDGFETRLVVLDLATGDELAAATFDSLPDEYASVLDGTRVAASTTDGAAVLDVETGELRTVLTARGGGPAVLFDPVTETMFAVGWRDRELVAVDLSATGPPALGSLPGGDARRFEAGGGSTISVSSGVDTPLSGRGGWRVDLVDVETGEWTGPLAEEPFESYVFAPLATAGGEAVAWHEHGPPATPVRALVEWRATGSVTTFDGCSVRRLSPDGRRAVLFCMDGSAAIIDVETGARITELPVHGFIIKAEFGTAGPAAERVLLNVDNHVVKLVDAETGDAVLQHDHPDGDLFGAELSDDGRTGVLGSASGVVTVVDLEAATAAGRIDPAVHVTTLDTGSGVVALGLDAADGFIAAANTSDGGGRLHVWHADTLDPWATLPIDVRGNALVIRDGVLLYTDDRLIRRMPLDDEALVALGESRRTRDFTGPECVAYRIDDCPTD